jgi:hypothetical protein
MAMDGFAGGSFPASGASTQILREDLLDAAINLDKEKSAATFLAIPKTVANGITHEWLLDQLPATSTAGTSEGATWASGGVTGRTRLANSVQTFYRTFQVTMDMLTYSLKGRAPSVDNEYEHQVENFLLVQAQSMNARIVAKGTDASAVFVTDSTAVGLMAGFRGFQLTATADPSGGVQGTAAATNALSHNVSGAWSRTRFLQLHEAMFRLGANPNTLIVGPGVKADITNDILGEVAQSSNASASSIYGIPTVVRQMHTDSSGTEFTQDIQFIRTDYGRVAILVDRFVPEGTTSATNARGSTGVSGAAVFLIDRSKTRLAFWRPLKHYPLPPDGDRMRGYVHAGATLEAQHPNTIGVLYNITT